MDESEVSHLNKIISNRVTSGVVILDTSGQILYINEEAQSILSTLNFNLKDTDSQDPDSLNRAIVEIFKSSLGSLSTPMSKCVYCPDSDSAYALRALPLHKPELQDKCILVLIEGVTIHRKFDMKVVQKQFGLTRREAEVTFCLTKGLTNKEIANALSLSPETVHDYVKQVMKKLDTSTRAGVVGKVLP